MRPVVVTREVPQPPEVVYDRIDVLADHEAFTDHLLIDWQASGPRSGVGARASMRIRKPGRPDRLEMVVAAAERPRRTVEESVSAGGRRRTRGTYELAPNGAGGTRISFEFAWLEAPLSERILAPLTRLVTRRANAESLRRLAERLSADPEKPRGMEQS